MPPSGRMRQEKFFKPRKSIEIITNPYIVRGGIKDRMIYFITELIKFATNKKRDPYRTTHRNMRWQMKMLSAVDYQLVNKGKGNSKRPMYFIELRIVKWYHRVRVEKRETRWETAHWTRSGQQRDEMIQPSCPGGRQERAASIFSRVICTDSCPLSAHGPWQQAFVSYSQIK